MSFLMDLNPCRAAPTSSSWACVTQPSAAVKTAAAHVEEVEVERRENSFECILKNRDAKPWGLRLDCWLDGWQVIDVTPGGVIDLYNQGVHDEQRILAHDFITRINDFRDLERIYQEMQRLSNMKVRVVRPSCWMVRVSKGMGPLGLVLDLQSKVSTCLKIIALENFGAAASHNEECAESARLSPNDFIERVNAVSGSADEMLQEIHRSTVVDLSVLRMPKPKQLVDIRKRPSQSEHPRGDPTASLGSWQHHPGAGPGETLSVSALMRRPSAAPEVTLYENSERSPGHRR